jgi:hypothetical protein
MFVNWILLSYVGNLKINYMGWKGWEREINIGLPLKE